MKAVMNQVKKDDVKLVGRLLEEYPIVGIVDMESLPGKNLARMRKQLRDKVVLLMKKKRLIKIALKDCKKEGIQDLEKDLEGMPALLFTKENPFSLFKTLKKNQSAAPIKPGQVAPKDLIVPAGPTSFPPGPIISELGALGIKAGVEEGKVAIKEDATLAKEGDVVDEKAAAFLTRMGIEPMRIGLKLVSVWEEGKILTGKVLNIDEDAFMADLAKAVGDARAISLELAIPTKDTIEALLQRAHVDTTSLARETGILTSDNVGEILAQAAAAAAAIEPLVPDAPKAEETPAAAPAEPEAQAEEPKAEETPAAETPAEPAPTEEKPAEPVQEAPAEKSNESKPEEPAPTDEKPAETPAEPAPEVPVEPKADEVASAEEPAPPEAPMEKAEVKEATPEVQAEPEEKKNDDAPAKPDDAQDKEA